MSCSFCFPYEKSFQMTNDTSYKLCVKMSYKYFSSDFIYLSPCFFVFCTTRWFGIPQPRCTVTSVLKFHEKIRFERVKNSNQVRCWKYLILKFQSDSFRVEKVLPETLWIFFFAIIAITLCLR